MKDNLVNGEALVVALNVKEEGENKLKISLSQNRYRKVLFFD